MTLEDECTQLLTLIPQWARFYWHRDGERCDMSEYEDAAYTAMVGCLQRFDPQRGIRFRTYATYRLRYAMRDAAEGYHTWQRGMSNHPFAHWVRPLPWEDTMLHTLDLHQRLRPLCPRAQRTAQYLLEGYLFRDIAALEGITPSALSNRLRYDRQHLSHQGQQYAT